MLLGRATRRTAGLPAIVGRAGRIAGVLAVALLLGACSRNPAPVVYPPPPPPPPPPSLNYAEEMFRAGWQALNSNRFEEAIAFLQRAVQEDGAESASRQIAPAPGVVVPYLPHYFLGVARARLGDCRGAYTAWEASERQGVVQRTPEYAQLGPLLDECRARLAQAAPSAPNIRDDPAESEQRYRAEAALAAATAAARRAEQRRAAVVALGRNPDFGREWQRAESQVADASRRFQSALTNPDLAAFDQVTQLSEEARQSFESLLHHADRLAAEMMGAPRPEMVGEPPSTEILSDRSTVQPPEPGAPSSATPPAAATAPASGSPPPAPPTTTPEAAEAGTAAIPFQWILLGTGVVLLSSIMLVAVLVPHPTPFQYVAFRTTLSLAATCVAASIPWLMSGSGDVQRAGSIGGALAIFVIVYFLDPIGRLSPQTSGPPVATGVPAGIATLPPIADACIFLSYRRSDSEDVVGRLHSALVETFGDAAVFKDVDDVTLGIDYRKVLKDAVGSCRVILAVIGPAWEAVRNDTGQRRIDDSADWVRIEIGSALQRNIPVIPVLIRRQQLPPATDLPDDLRDLVYRQAIQLRPDPDFDNDVARLVANLNRLLSMGSAAPS
jgi:hypothetical protein